MSYDLICDEVMLEGEGTPVSKRSFESADYERISHDFLLQRCRTLFKAKNTIISDGENKRKALQFNAKETLEAGASFNLVSEIVIYDSVQDEELTEDQDVTDLRVKIGGGN